MAKKALCIGINDYPGTDSDLEDRVNDPNDFLPPSVYLSRREVANLSMRHRLRASSPPALRDPPDGRLPGHGIQLRRLFQGKTQR
jgi:metacaspase-1